MKVFFVCPIHNLDLGKDPISYEVSDNCFITNQFQQIKDNIPHFEKFITDVGQNEIYCYIIYHCYAWGIFELEAIPENKNPVPELNYQAFSFGHKVTDYLSSIWYIKDSACCISHINYQMPTHNCLSGMIVLGQIDFTANGTSEAITLTTNEAVQAAAFQELSKLNIPHKLTKQKVQLNQRGDYDYLYNYQETNRVSRARSFIFSARSEKVIHTKITYYVIAFESLFTTNSEDIGKALRKRVPYYFYDSDDNVSEDKRNEMVTMSKLIKDAYGIRSSYLHGTTISKGLVANMQRISIELDNLLRGIMVRIITSDFEIFLRDNKDKHGKMKKGGIQTIISRGLIHYFSELESKYDPDFPEFNEDKEQV